jgi:hypothetical protein
VGKRLTDGWKAYRRHVYPQTYSYMRIRYALHKRLSLVAGSPIVNTTTMMRKSSNTKVEMTHGGRTTTSLRVKTKMSSTQ